MIARRSFIAGMIGLVAAPAIVRAASLMPVRAFDPYYTRYLIDYMIGTDQEVIRVDRALFPLIVPNNARTIPAHIAHTYIPKHRIDSMRPIEGQQLTIHGVFDGQQQAA